MTNMAKKKKPIIVKPKFKKRERQPAAFIRTKLKTAADDVVGVGLWRRLKTAGAATTLAKHIPHPFAAEMLMLPPAFGLLGAGLGSLVDEEDAALRYGLASGLAGLGVALGRGAGARFFPQSSSAAKGVLSGAGAGGGLAAADEALAQSGHKPIFGDEELPAYAPYAGAYGSAAYPQYY